MKCITTVLQICAVLVGFVSAWYWWKSANTGPVEIPAVDKPQGDGPGDLLLDWGADKMMHIRSLYILGSGQISITPAARPRFVASRTTSNSPGGPALRRLPSTRREPDRCPLCAR
jgi:hypothetical protein